VRARRKIVIREREDADGDVEAQRGEGRLGTAREKDGYTWLELSREQIGIHEEDARRRFMRTCY